MACGCGKKGVPLLTPEQEVARAERAQQRIAARVAVQEERQRVREERRQARAR